MDFSYSEDQQAIVTGARQVQVVVVRQRRARHAHVERGRLEARRAVVAERAVVEPPVLEPVRPVVGPDPGPRDSLRPRAREAGPPFIRPGGPGDDEEEGKRQEAPAQHQEPPDTRSPHPRSGAAAYPRQPVRNCKPKIPARRAGTHRRR